MKLIVGFRSNERGLFLDLEDQRAAVAVNPSTGEILLDEGSGEDRINSAAIVRRDQPRFILSNAGKNSTLSIEFAPDRRMYFLGQTEKSAEAQEWVVVANDIFGHTDVADSAAQAMPSLMSTAK